MDTQIDAFCDSIGLSDNDAQILKDKYNESTQTNTTDATNTTTTTTTTTKRDLVQTVQLELACLAAQLALGLENVAVSPINLTLSESNWSETCYFQPFCLYQPTSAAGVSTALKIINFFQVKFSTRSGGHSPNPGWASNVDGFLIDLQKINAVTLDSQKQVASLGPGARWGEVYDTLDAMGATVLGGRIPHVGVGGLMLGGGFFHFSGEYGMAADRVKNFQIVLANGTVTNANAAQNSDLFWALKGGGPNFGIVTRYDVYTVPITNVWYRWDAYSVDQAEVVLDAMAQWQAEGQSDVKSTVALIMSLDNIVVGLLYSAAADSPSAFAPFYDIPTMANLVPPINGTVKSLTDFLANTFSSEPLRHDYRAGSSLADAQLYKDVWNFWKGRAQQVRNATGANQTFTIQPVSKGFAQQGINMGGNPMGIPLEDHQWWTTVIDWRDEADDDVVRAVSIETEQAWQTLGAQRGLGLSHTFMNDASRDQNPLAGYGAGNLSKLKQIALKYDSKQVFQKLQNGGFLLSNA